MHKAHNKGTPNITPNMAGWCAKTPSCPFDCPFDDCVETSSAHLSNANGIQYEAVLSYLVEHKATNAQAAAFFGVSTRTIYRILHGPRRKVAT